MRDLAARWDVRCMNKKKLRAKRREHAISDVPSTKRLDGTRRTGQGWRVNENGRARGPSFNGAELQRCFWTSHLFSMALKVAHHATRTHI